MQLQGKIALITGASRGIGQAAAIRYAREGATLYLLARSSAGLQETDDLVRSVGGAATLVPLDLKEPEGIEKLANAIGDKHDRLDILVGNAAMLGVLSPLTHVTPKIWEDALATNLTANWRLLRAFDPLLRASKAGRAMFVTSGITQGTFPYWGPYAVTKAALEVMVQTYAAETEKTPIRANLIDPGVIRTRMRAEAFPGEDPLNLPAPESITDIFVELALESCKKTGEIFHARPKKSAA